MKHEIMQHWRDVTDIFLHLIYVTFSLLVFDHVSISRSCNTGMRNEAITQNFTPCRWGL